MTKETNANPSIEPDALHPNHTQAPTKPGLPEKEGDSERLNQVADRLAHKGAKAEQEFDKENGGLFTK